MERFASIFDHSSKLTFFPFRSSFFVNEREKKTFFEFSVSLLSMEFVVIRVERAGPKSSLRYIKSGGIDEKKEMNKISSSFRKQKKTETTIFC